MGSFRRAEYPADFSNERQALGYTRDRASCRSGEIHFLDSPGNLQKTISFTAANRKL